MAPYGSSGVGSDASLTTETGGREVKPCNRVSAVLLSFNSLRISTNAVRAPAPHGVHAVVLRNKKCMKE